MMGSMKKVIFLDKEKQLSNGKDSNPPRSKKNNAKGVLKFLKTFSPMLDLQNVEKLERKNP